LAAGSICIFAAHVVRRRARLSSTIIRFFRVSNTPAALAAGSALFFKT